MSYRSLKLVYTPLTFQKLTIRHLSTSGDLLLNTLLLMQSSSHTYLSLISARNRFTSLLFQSERTDYLTQRSELPFINEGIAYTVDYDADVEVHRFFNKLTGRHLYTVSDFETQLLLDDIHSSYLYEGVAFKVFDTSISDTFRTPVYRFYDSISHIHYFTANSYELDLWTSSNPLWINEGIAWYA